MELTAKEKNALTSGAIDFTADVGAGVEGADKDSYAIPFLRVLQKGSPQCEEGDAAYIPEAKAGMLINSVSEELYDGKEGVIFLPCAFQRRFLQWAPRGSDGGLRGEHMPEEIEQMRADGKLQELEGKLLLVDGDGAVSEKRSDVMSDTRSHFGLLVDKEGRAHRVIMPLGSTQIKKSKQLMYMLSSAQIDGATPPTWMNQIRVTTVLESNDQGSWHGVRFQSEGFITDPELYAQGKALHTALKAGQVGADHAKEAAKDEKF